jgi:hypothetical protein
MVSSVSSAAKPAATLNTPAVVPPAANNPNNLSSTPSGDASSQSIKSNGVDSIKPVSLAVGAGLFISAAALLV